MTERTTEVLLRDLATGLAPVQPIPRLGVVAAAAVAAGAAGVAGHALFGGAVPGLVPGVPWGQGVFLLVLLGLACVAGGAVAAALAGAVPGREADARRGRVAAGVGLAVTAAGGAWGVLAGATPEPPVAASFGCTVHATALGLAPGLVLGFFLGRAFTPRPLAQAVFAAAGAVALGSVIVHATCAAGGALHMTVGHFAAPLLASQLLALPLAGLLRRVAQPT